ncbi:MAG: FlgD immunoglobulin-like domain containing protein, partial [Bacteroidota bacterium]
LDFEYTYDLSTSNQGSGFLKLPNGVRVRFTAENSSLWQTIYLINNAVATEFQEELALYPNPFILNGFDVIKIPIEDVSAEEVTLYIFTSNLELVYSKTLQPNLFLGRFVLTWNGKNTDGVDVGSGIYFYTIESKKGTTRGKFAVVQQ